MSQENVENARRSYATLNEAYRQGDASVFLPILEEMWVPDAVFEPAGVLPDTLRDGKVTRCEVPETVADALEAAGLRE